MPEKLSREELLVLVEEIMTEHDKKTGELLSEQDHFERVKKFKRSINHKRGTDLIYYPTHVGLSENPSVEEIVELAIKGE